MYHDVQPQAPGVTGGSDHFTVSSSAFAQQLDRMLQLGFKPCSIAQALERPARKTLALSFDDGDLGQFQYAFPELEKRGLTATFFITTGWVGSSKYVSWDQLRTMKAAGMSIQSHTRSHRFLSQLDSEELLEELAGAKSDLDQQLRQDTTMLAFPGGDPPPRSHRHLIGQAGYSVVATSVWGLNTVAEPGTDAIYLRRCTIRGNPPLTQFDRVLEGDRWLSARRRVRDSALRSLHLLLGRPRYARWRARFLDWIS